MKKTIFALVIILLIITVFIIMKRHQNDDVKIKVFFVDSFPEEEVISITFCAINKYNDFDLIKVEVPSDVDIYHYVFELYNHRRNALPLDYDVISNSILELETITKEDKKLYLKIKDQKINPEELHWTLYALKITYRYLGIEELHIEINNQSYIY